MALKVRYKKLKRKFNNLSYEHDKLSQFLKLYEGANEAKLQTISEYREKIKKYEVDILILECIIILLFAIIIFISIKLNSSKLEVFFKKY